MSARKTKTKAAKRKAVAPAAAAPAPTFGSLTPEALLNLLGELEKNLTEARDFIIDGASHHGSVQNTLDGLGELRAALCGVEDCRGFLKFDGTVAP